MCWSFSVAPFRKIECLRYTRMFFELKAVFTVSIHSNERKISSSRLYHFEILLHPLYLELTVFLTTSGDFLACFFIRGMDSAVD